jgi:hypothetical protein
MGDYYSFLIKGYEVRRRLYHAVTCEISKRQHLNVDVRSELIAIAQTDVDASVRKMALQELAEMNE